MSRELNNERNKINFTVACVNAFAETYNMNVKEAYRYLRDFKGIEFLKDFYDVEHDLAYAEVIGYNRDNEQREHMNEVKQKERE
ncbi:DUF3791 domain-containing protein [Butyrivibrio sp. AC2005]|uniref:DUF3791 domain-containing protein n=1 Tax=Butyrivibrio sp. AC2005 TaxID=1280672 RepID=UPI000422898A|nr:DUF3791 domain-containing protein [Butyrivibrio sp. AC2005]